MTRAMQYQPSGILIVDKPADVTSAKVVARVKKSLKAKKVGHAGTLDPLATGVLVCLINRATRIARFFLQGNKKYEAVLCLGIETDTQDATGKVISRCDEITVSERSLRTAFKMIEGENQQVPPVFSALKQNGTPLYKLARSGKPVQKPARRVFISSVRMLEINLPIIRFEVSCTSGTYIRTLCADIGRTLGCGGHLKELRRLESSGFTLEKAVTVTELEKLASSGKLSEQIIGMSKALEDFPEIVADHTLAQKILHGQTITRADFRSGQIDRRRPGDFIKIVDKKDHLLAIINEQRDNCVYKYCCVLQ